VRLLTKLESLLKVALEIKVSNYSGVTLPLSCPAPLLVSSYLFSVSSILFVGAVIACLPKLHVAVP
jgi:hypothetical protein